MGDTAWPLYVSAVVTGAAIGYVIQRGGFCLMRALANFVLMGDAASARAYVLAFLVAMASVQALAASGLVEFPIRPFHWMSNCIGGLVFGVGMVMLVGVPVGAFAAAWPSGDFRWKLPPGWSLVKIFSRGLLMGSSSIIAAGCNITQGLTNGSAFALGSLVTLASMLVGGWLTLRALYDTTR